MGNLDKVSLDLIQVLFSHVMVGVVILDDNYNIICCNQQAYKALKLTERIEDAKLIALCKEIAQSCIAEAKGAKQFTIKFGDVSAELLPFMLLGDNGKMRINYFLCVQQCQKKNADSDCNDVSECNLTRREKQVLDLIARGYSNDVISKNLSISFHTVKTHRQNIYKKYNVSNSMNAVSKYLACDRERN